MDYRGFDPLQTTEFGGWNTFYENVQLVPPPFSPLAYNVQFRRGGVRTRPGLTQRGAYGASTIPLAIKDYVLLNTTERRLLVLDSSGVLIKIAGAYSAFTLLPSGFTDAANAPDLMMISQTAFGREYIGLGKDGVGFHVPLAYDDTHLDPVAPSGPAGAPHVVEGSATSRPESIAAGTHYYRVCYRTRNGYITPPGPMQLHVSNGGNQVTISKVYPGPEYVTGRIIVATPTNNPSDYFFIPGKMEIGDNVTDTISFDFADPELINGVAVSVRSDPGSDMLNCINLDEQAGCIFYHGRLGWFGGRASLRSVGDNWPKNLAFDGGFAVDDVINAVAPCGWRALKRYHGAGFSEGGPDGKVGQGLTITGDGTHSSIMQALRTVTPDGVNYNLLSWPTGKDIKVRVRCRKSSNAADVASLFFYMLADTATIDDAPTKIAVVPVNQMSDAEWRWIEVDFASAAETLLADFAHRMVNLGTSGDALSGPALPSNEKIFIDRIEFFVSGQAFEPATIRWSRPNQPDAYDDLLGQQTFGLGDGHRITGGFVIGDNCYVIKEHSVYVTRDDGQNEPGFWNTSVVSPSKGSESPRGHDEGERWAVVASRSGLHFFDGTGFHSLSSDIFRTWERINWAAASKLFVLVDTDNQRLFVGAPLDDETEAEHLLCLEYIGGSFESARWSEWQILDGTFSAGVVYHRPDGVRDVLFGGKSGTYPWNLLAIDETSHRDTVQADVSNTAGVAITSRYRLPYLPAGDGRYNWGDITANVWGAGQLKIIGYMPDNATLVTEGNRGCLPMTLNASPVGDYEWIVDVTAERMSWQLQTEDLDSWFALNRFVQYLKQKPYSALRGQRKPV